MKKGQHVLYAARTGNDGTEAPWSIVTKSKRDLTGLLHSALRDFLTDTLNYLDYKGVRTGVRRVRTSDFFFGKGCY